MSKWDFSVIPDAPKAPDVKAEPSPEILSKWDFSVISDAPQAPAANAEPSDGEALDRYVADYNRRNPDSPITRADIPDRSGLWGSVEELGSGLKSAVLDQFPEDMARIWEGGDVSLDESSWARKLIREQEKDRSRRVLSRQVIEGDTWAKSLYQGPQSVATSAATGAAGSVAGGAAGSAVPVVGTAAGAVVGAAAGSGVAFYRLAKNQFLHEVLSLAKGKKIELTPEEWEGIKADVEDEAVKIGLWEAGPEALSQAFTVGLLKGVGGRVFGSVPGLSKITQAISKNALTRVGAKLAAEVGEEEVTEGMTYFGQEAIRKDVGLREDDPSLGEFVREQAGPVAVGSVLQIGGMGAVERAFGRGRKKGGDTGQEGQAAEHATPAPEASAEAAQNAAQEAGPVETPAAEDVLPYTRADAEQDLVGRYGEADGKGLLGMFDALAESWAEREGRDPSEWFEKHLAGIVSEDRDRALGAEELGQAAMRSSEAASLEDFLAEARAGDKVFRLEERTPDAVREVLDAPEAVVNISADFVRHLDNERPGEADALVAETPDILANADKVVFCEDRGKYGGKRYAAVRTVGDEAQVVVFDRVAGKRGDRIIPVTAFKNNAKAVENALASGVKGERSTVSYGGVSQEVIRAISALDETSIDDSMSQGKARWSFPQPEASGPGIGLEAVRAVLAPLQEAAENAAPLEVVSDLAALPEHLRRDAAQGGGTPEAVLDPRSGTVYVLADAVRSPERAVALWLHEQGLHVGLRGLFGQDAARLDAFLDQTFEHFGAESFRELAEAHGLDLSTEDGRRRAAEERLAVLAEKVVLGRDLDAAEQGLWDRVLEMVREWLRERGVDLGLRDADIARVVRDSVRWTMGDRRARGDERTLYQSASGTSIFYSQLERVLSAKLSNGTAAQHLKTLDAWVKKGEFKGEELEWSGLREWLAGRGDQKTSKEEVLDFLRQGGVKVEEVVKGGEGGRTPRDPAVVNHTEALEDFGLEIVQNDDDPSRWAVYDGASGDMYVEPGSADRYEDYFSPGIINHINALLTYLASGGLPTKFSDYQIPGGENYRELLLTLPTGVRSSSAINDEIRYLDRSLNSVSNYDERDRIRSRMKALSEQYKEAVRRERERYSTPEQFEEAARREREKNFRSSHFPEPNILAHVRFNERTDAEGKRVLFIEEIQSDWAQKGRKEGFREPITTWEQYLASRGIKRDESGLYTEGVSGKLRVSEDAVRKQYEEMKKPGADQSVPDAPFVKNTSSWSMLAMKRMIRWAAENGFDKVAWTTGEQQAERYDLSKQIGELAYWRDGDQYGLSAVDSRGDMLPQLDQATFSENDLEGVVGKEVALKIINDEGDEKSQYGFPDNPGVKYLRGAGLKVGGEGMKGFYDKILPSETNKLIKKWGGKVGETQIEKRAVHAFDITGQMRESALSGLPLFQKSASGKSPRAAVTFLDDGRALIRLFTSADPTSVIHEAGHVLRRMLDAGDTAVVEKWAGAEGGVWTREAEEKFARAFERYCYEGAAPTARLRQVLSKLRNMLVRIYGNLKNLGVAEIPAEVRAVFDKMLSTEKERAAEREMVRRIHSFAVDPDAREATYEEPPAHPADIREWGDLMAEAERRAQAHFDKERRKELRALRAEWRAEGKEVADNHPAHWVMDQVGGLDADSLARDYDAEFIRELSRKRPGLVRRGALAYDIALASVGVEDSDAMLTRILEAPTKAEIVKDWMERREAEWERMRTQAGDFGQEYFAVQDAALEILGQMTERRNDQFARAKAREAVDEMAAASLGKEAVRLRNERAKLNKAAAQAFESGDRVAAGATLRKLRESDYLLREVERARYERERILRSVSVSLARKIPEEFREQARAWAARLGYKGGAGDAGRSLLEFLSPRGLHHFVDQDAIRSLERAPAGALNMDQMRRARDVLRQIVYFGDTENKLLAGKEAQEFDRVLAQVVGSVLGNKKTAARAESVAHPAAPSARRESPLAGFLSGVRDAHAELLKPEFLFRSMDGFKAFGPVWEACYAPLKAAEDAELALGAETYARLREAFKPFEGEFRDWRRKRLTIKEVPRNVETKSWRGGVTFKPGQPLRLTKEEILMVALNMGNTGNRNALKKGFMWTDGDLAAITSRLSREEWGLVERVWEIVDSLYPKLAETSRRISGAAPKKVAAEPFQARTSDGSEIEVRGGYFPLVFDRELSWKADRFAALAEDRDLFQNIYQQPKPASGMTIERKGGTMAPLLSLEVLGRHVRDTAHYATHAAAVRDVQKIVADERFRSAVDRAYGDGTYRQLAPWLQHVAKPVREETSFVEKWVGRLRRNTSVVTMGLKVSTAMMQPTAFTQAVNELGFVPSMKGLAHFLAHPWRSVEFVNERSLAMRNRRRRWDREVADAYGKFNPAEFRGSRAVKDAFFGMMGFMDAMTAYPAWMAAYAKAMEEHGWDEAKACEYADMVVRRTQGAGGSPLDMARVQHGSELKKTLTMFYSFYSVFWNQFVEIHARVGRGDAGVVDLFKCYWWVLVLPAVLGDWSHWGDYDDPEKALKRGGQAVAGYVLAGLPVLRDVVSPMLTGYGYRFSPVSDAAEAPVDLWRAMQAKKDRPRKVAKAAIMAAGYFWGLPSRQAVIGMEGALDLMQGRTDNPARLLFPAPKEEKGKKRMTYGGGK